MDIAKKSIKIESMDPFELAPQDDDENKLDPIEDPNATDYSSSFADTLSETENCSVMSDNEAESSRFYGSDTFPFDGFSSMFPMRKKKPTSHWRNYIRPLMWRCKWAQLKMMEFRYQALKYDREIARNDKKKQQKSDHSILENLDKRTLPSSTRSEGEKVMKRRKRKRVEDDPADIASYLSQHNLFSYVENKRAEQDGSSVIEEFGNPGSVKHKRPLEMEQTIKAARTEIGKQLIIPEQNSSGREGFGIHEDCSYHEENNEFIGEILENIEMTHSRVQILKSRLVAILEENCMNFSSSEDLSFFVLRDGQTSTPLSPNLSACDGDTSSLGALLNEIGDFVVPDNIVDNYGEHFCVPDIIESTDSLLSSVDVTMIQPRIGDSREAIMDNGELQIAAVKIERLDFENIKNQTTGNIYEIERTIKEESDIIPAPVSASETVAPQSKASNLAPEANFQKYKRKRGERKAGSSGWHR